MVSVKPPVTSPPASSIPSSPQWVVAWGASPENALPAAENPGGDEQSFRFLLLPTIDGTQERVHFSNLFGLTPITIGAARLAVATGSGAAIDPTRDTPLTFAGASSITLAAGQEVVSDPVNITYAFGETMAVSVYMKGAFPPLTQHDSQVTTNYESVSQAGNTTTDASGASFSQAVTEWYLLTGIDTYGSYQGTVALFGSSSIDGHESNYGDTNSYPVLNVAIPGQDNDRPADWLARQLMSAGYRLGVLNAGELGDPAGEDASTAAGTGLAGIDRMKHDVLQQAGVKTVVIYFGGIDLREDCVPATNVEASLSNMVSQAQAVGVRVILATLPPAEYCTTSSADLLPSAANPYQGDLYPGPENPGSTQRRTLNDWIRTTGALLPGVVAIADFDNALLYPVHPDFMMPSFYSSDNFHPNGVGYGVQSSAIPLTSLLAPR
ncbi:GDSL-type esterase/lipase family protein [Granulicella mallensis]|uniref:GDSL-type esterase/lipase family protein n=1 Tax=Granulicella mallensis TaxID=940614 RepID=UPI001CBE9B8C|nr:GDSL-type esterase/lipase family protein [Granulicella mallensis]